MTDLRPIDNYRCTNVSYAREKMLRKVAFALNGIDGLWHYAAGKDTRYCMLCLCVTSASDPSFTHQQEHYDALPPDLRSALQLGLEDLSLWTAELMKLFPKAGCGSTDGDIGC